MTRLLIRFDDLCPTMDWGIWDTIERLLDEAGVQPILAVVPDNRDARLAVGPPNPEFWSRARTWQSKGWIIGQHGYRHVFDSRDPGLVPWWRQSEFAGHPFEVQLSRISDGFALLRAENLTPVAWVAPAHTFDAVTLQVLRRVGIGVVSDGVGFRPYVDGLGLVWIPQQPWRPRALTGGTWTVCFHSNQASCLDPLRLLLSQKRSELMGVRFTFQDLLAGARPKAAADSAFESLYWAAFSSRRRLRDALKRRQTGSYVPDRY
jgi:predicted deacetylase